MSSSTTVEFQPLQAEHISLLRQWLKEPHVAEFWQETEVENELREKFLVKISERGVSAFLISLNKKLIGYIQYYEAHKVGGGWWPEAKPGVFGIDQFIGDPAMLNKGVGTEVIKSFVEQLFQNHKVNEIITDPDPKNKRAIRAYEKVGFQRIGEIKTPGGDALLMRLTRLDLTKSSSQEIDIQKVEGNNEKSHLCEKILRALPEWFGIESAILNYIADVKFMETWAARVNGETVGFLSLNKPNKATAEIHVMGVLEAFHRSGVGRRLVLQAERSLGEQGFQFLQVKTLSESRPNKEYDATRAFYLGMGFFPVEEFKTLWGDANPCLLLIKKIETRTGRLHHVEIYVSDLKKTTEFWSWLLCDQLGYHEFQKWESGVSYKKGETYLVFVQTENRFLEPGYHRCRVGLNHLAFHSRSKADVDNLVSELKSRGIKILYSDKQRQDGGNSYAIFFEDPDRIKVEVVAP